MAVSQGVFLRSTLAGKTKIQLMMILKNYFDFTIKDINAKHYHRNELSLFTKGLENFWIYPKPNKSFKLFNHLGQKSTIKRIHCVGRTARNLKISFKNTYAYGHATPSYVLVSPEQNILTLKGEWKPAWDLALGELIKCNHNDMGYVWVSGMELINDYQAMFGIQLESGFTYETATGLFLN